MAGRAVVVVATDAIVRRDGFVRLAGHVSEVVPSNDAPVGAAQDVVLATVRLPDRIAVHVKELTAA